MKIINTTLLGLSLLIVMICNSCRQSDDYLIPVGIGDYYGYINTKGKIVINPQYLYASDFIENFALVKTSSGYYGYIDKSGKLVIPDEYVSGTIFSEGLAFVVKECEHPKCIDNSGKVIFELKDARVVFAFCDGLARVYTDKGSYFVDKKGRTVITLSDNQQVDDFHEGLASCSFDDKQGFINKQGEVVIAPQFGMVPMDSYARIVGGFYDGLSKVVPHNSKNFYDNKYGFINKEGKYIINPQYEEAHNFQEGLCAVKKGDKWGFVDKNGKMIIDAKYNVVGDFSEGLATFCEYYESSETSKDGYINTKGSIKIVPEYDCACDFKNGIAMVEKDGKWGAINKNGKVVVELQFENYLYYDYDRQPKSIESNYYDASDFVNKLFQNATENYFKGFKFGSILKDIYDHYDYDNVKIKDNHIIEVYTDASSNTEDELVVGYLTFYFDEIKTKEIDYWWGTEQVNDENSKIKAFCLAIFPNDGLYFGYKNNSDRKAASVAKALKEKIEQFYHVKMVKDKCLYYALRNDNISFVIIYSIDYRNSTVYLYVPLIPFDKTDLESDYNIQAILKEINN